MLKKFFRRGVVQPHSRRPQWQRALFLALALPPSILGVFSLTLAYRIYASNRVEKSLPAMPGPKKAQRLLVFAPHPDDETLGAAGLMRQARLRGDDVRVVVLTNGDGFRISAAKEFSELTVPPRDFVRYGYLRQSEARTALGVLGIPRDHVLFLGYPDRGLMPMWITNWAPDRPFRSAYTLAAQGPYADAPAPHAPYCGEALLQDIRQQMLTDKPTDIFVTHPNDDHPDHAAASVFVRSAFEQLKAAGIPWAQTAHLHYYLVHRGDWPTPQGLHEDAGLAPPGPMMSLDTRWQSLPLTLRDMQKKYAALKRYHSQIEMSSRFLFSFVRQNELFGTLDGTDAAPALVRVPSGRFHIDGDGQEWEGISPIALDPAGDNLGRFFQPGSDVTRLYACRDNRFVFIRLDMRGHLSSRVAYQFTLRPIVPGDTQPQALVFSVVPGSPGHPHALPGISGGIYAWRGNLMEAAIPVSRVGLAQATPDMTLYVMAQTRIANIEIDRTGFRAVSCSLLPSKPILTATR